MGCSQQLFPRTLLFLYHGLFSTLTSADIVVFVSWAVFNTYFRGHCCFCIVCCFQHLLPRTLLFLYHGLFSTLTSADTVVFVSWAVFNTYFRGHCCFCIVCCFQHLLPRTLLFLYHGLFSTLTSADTVVFVSWVVLSNCFRAHCCFCITVYSPTTVVSGDTVVGHSFCVTGCSRHSFPWTLSPAVTSSPAAAEQE